MDDETQLIVLRSGVNECIIEIKKFEDRMKIAIFEGSADLDLRVSLSACQDRTRKILSGLRAILKTNS
jgi:hypothetical protein|tara:strand:- start:255 stop:458 length:204 start_codon:yes stop_codon:yes gene_type:complete